MVGLMVDLMVYWMVDSRVDALELIKDEMMED
jgi:hypothetical protein